MYSNLGARRCHHERRAISVRWACVWEQFEIGTNVALDKGAEQVLADRALTIDKSRGRNAKVRIVLFGFQHLEVQCLQTTAPTQCHMDRLCLLQCCRWRGFLIESCDATIVFLQAQGNIEPERIYCQGAGALAVALGADDPGVALNSFEHVVVLLRIQEFSMKMFNTVC